MVTLQPQPHELASPPPTKEGGTGETGQTALWLAATLPALDPQQRAYLGLIQLRRRESVALLRARVSPPELVAWRQDQTFAAAERLTRALAWDVQPALSRSLVRANGVAAALRQAELIEQDRDLPTAARMVDSALDRSPETARVSSGAKAGVTIATPSDATMELYLRITSGQAAPPSAARIAAWARGKADEAEVAEAIDAHAHVKADTGN